MRNSSLTDFKSLSDSPSTPPSVTAADGKPAGMAATMMENTRPARTAFRDMMGQAKLSLNKSASSNPYLKDTSPVFHQFLDCLYQILILHPTRFEYNERFLRRLLYHLYSCQYGNFIYNNERERLEVDVTSRTRSVWSYFLSRRKEFLNPDYDLTADKDEGVIWPSPTHVQWWTGAFGLSASEMDGPTGATTTSSVAVPPIVQEMAQMSV